MGKKLLYLLSLAGMFVAGSAANLLAGVLESRDYSGSLTTPALDATRIDNALESFICPQVNAVYGDVCDSATVDYTVIHRRRNGVRKTNWQVNGLSVYVTVPPEEGGGGAGGGG